MTVDENNLEKYEENSIDKRKNENIKQEPAVEREDVTIVICSMDSRYIVDIKDALEKIGKLYLFNNTYNLYI